MNVVVQHYGDIMLKLFLFCISLFTGCEIKSAYNDASRYNQFTREKIDVNDIFMTRGVPSVKALKKIRQVGIGKQSATDSHRHDVEVIGLYDVPGWHVSMFDSLDDAPSFIRHYLKKEVYYKKFIQSNPIYQFSLPDTDYSSIDIRPHIVNIFPLEISSDKLDTSIYKNIQATPLRYKYSNMNFSGNTEGVNLANFKLESDSNNFSLLIHHKNDSELYYYSLSPLICTFSAIKSFNKNNFEIAVFLYKDVYCFVWPADSLWKDDFIKQTGSFFKNRFSFQLYIITIKYDGTIESIKFSNSNKT